MVSRQIRSGMGAYAGAAYVWSNPSDLDKKESDGRDPPEGVAPHAHREVQLLALTNSLASERPEGNPTKM